ncbi:MAG: DUF4124 domain-containing protein [Pseudomonadota bacterium]|nr:DUF4124 domain-containing protein [Pseudomonadota bacterium]
MNTTMKVLCLATSILFSVSAGAAFKCVDEKGLTHVGDTPPEPCAKVVMYEVTRSGAIIRKIDPSLTAEQAKARVEADDRRKEADKIANEQKRKDLALLATYSTATEFDVVLERSIQPIQARIKVAQERMPAIDKRAKELGEELEFYKAGKSTKSSSGKKVEAPVMLTSELERLRSERLTLAKNVADSEKEITDMRARFDVDKKRWLALKAGSGSTAADAPVAEAKPAAKPLKKSN